MRVSGGLKVQRSGNGGYQDGSMPGSGAGVMFRELPATLEPSAPSKRLRACAVRRPPKTWVLPDRVIVLYEASRYRPFLAVRFALGATALTATALSGPRNLFSETPGMTLGTSAIGAPVLAGTGLVVSAPDPARRS